MIRCSTVTVNGNVIWCFLLSDSAGLFVGVDDNFCCAGRFAYGELRACTCRRLGLECKVGFMQRPERVVLTSLGALFCGIFSDCEAFDPMLILIVPMVVIAILANLTAFARIAHCYKLLKKQ